VRLIEKVWFKKHQAKYWLIPLLLPLTGLFYLISTIRRLLFRLRVLKSYKVQVPVIVVGNISVGGNGKTPVVIYLVELLNKLGVKPGVISRGYGGNAEHYPYLLDENSTTQQAGDEPILIYQRCGVPVVVGSDRVANTQKLIKQGCNIIISDDGLQHYRLQRDMELVIVDAKRLFGNGLLLPAGPLREGVWRLQKADLVIYNGNKVDNTGACAAQSLLMNLAGHELIQVKTGEKITLSTFIQQWHTVNAIAGIGEPLRFFETLEALGFDLEKQQGFIDHKDFVMNDFDQFTADVPLLMTEKDAVKCRLFAQENWWYLPVSAQFSEQDEQILLHCLKTKLSI
jgi:tetraacyldisaccharide 4'-kinase